jgi:hypothetical protein
MATVAPSPAILLSPRASAELYKNDAQGGATGALGGALAASLGLETGESDCRHAAAAAAITFAGMRMGYDWDAMPRAIQKANRQEEPLKMRERVMVAIVLAVLFAVVQASWHLAAG